MNIESVTRLFCLLLMVLLPALAGAAQRVEVQVQGLSGELLDNVRASLALERNRGNAGLTAERIREAHNQASREIERALEPFGYYRPQIASDLQQPLGPDGAWTATYRIDAGPRVPVADLQIVFSGGEANDAALANIVAGLPLSEGQSLDHRDYEMAKRDLLAKVQSLGYRGASLAVHRVEVDLADYTAHVFLRVEMGPRYIIGAIEFEQDQFRADYLARYLLLEPGDAYTSSALAEQRRALSRSGYFREVEIQPLPATEEEPHIIPLRIRLATLPGNRYRVRLAWGTDTGAGAQLAWSRRYVGGRGQHFNVGIGAVEDRDKRAGDINYVIPLSPIERSKVTIGARHESKDLTFDDVELDEGGETRIETNLVSATWQPAHLRWGTFEVKPAVGLSLLGEDYDVFEVLFGNLPSSAQQLIIDNIGRDAYETLTPDFEAVMPNLRLTLRRSDDRLFIRRGDFLDLQLRGADDSLGSNFSFWQASLDTWHIRSLSEHSRLLLRAGLGYSDADSSEVLGAHFNDMPEYYEFRAGGARSVRGYGFEDLFPSDAITGGKHQLVGSIEIDYEFIPKWSAALFVDAGNAFNRWDDYDAKVGAGIGIRWRSPVGLARIDVGVPVNESDESIQVYITVGPEF